jgi:hypothetical protein
MFLSPRLELWLSRNCRDKKRRWGSFLQNWPRTVEKAEIIHRPAPGRTCTVPVNGCADALSALTAKRTTDAPRKRRNPVRSK